MNRNLHDILVDGNSLYAYYGLIPTTRPYIAPPSIKTNKIEIPGANGEIDLTENLTGYPLYNRRTGSWEFIVSQGGWGPADVNNRIVLPRSREDSYYAWLDKYNYLMSYINGREHAIELVDSIYPDTDEDYGYFYKGRLTVKAYKPGNKYSTVTIDYDLDPFRYSNKLRSKTFDVDYSKLTEIGSIGFSEFLMYANYFIPNNSEISGPSQHLSLPTHPTITVWPDDVAKPIEIGFVNTELNMNRSEIFGEGVHEAYRFTLSAEGGNKFYAKGKGRIKIEWRNRAL